MSREEAAAEIEAGGRRKEIADEAIRQAVCGSRKTEATAWNCGYKEDKVVSTEKLRLFYFIRNFFHRKKQDRKKHSWNSLQNLNLEVRVYEIAKISIR